MHAEIKSRRALPVWLSVWLTAYFASHALSEPSAGWALPGGGQGGGHFSAATQITPDNVSDLTIAWVHRSGDYSEGDNFIDGLSGTKPLQSSWQATPILIEDQLVICTPFNRIIAVDASTGEERWSFTPDIDVARLWYASLSWCDPVARPPHDRGRDGATPWSSPLSWTLGLSA
jgi:quinoprotein glucose dehydrogenase